MLTRCGAAVGESVKPAPSRYSVRRPRHLSSVKQRPLRMLPAQVTSGRRTSPLSEVLSFAHAGQTPRGVFSFRAGSFLVKAATRAVGARSQDREPKCAVGRLGAPGPPLPAPSGCDPLTRNQYRPFIFLLFCLTRSPPTPCAASRSQRPGTHGKNWRSPDLILADLLIPPQSTGRF